MGQALYRKYRSTSLSEIVGQEPITTALTQALKTGRISHAYLFTGPRGVGKTSIARILAYEINGLPYSTDPHLDIIEIDAASNRRIDEIRDLRDKVYIAPASAKYKVYIIDEVHMLTREAFNALLKTLEEPPAHVIFILATTDAHKLPETIISRTQRYMFRPVEESKVIAHLKHIAKEEKIDIDDEALALLAKHGEGSFRDSISMLDQIGNHTQRVTAETVREQLGIPPDEAVQALIDSLQTGEVSQPVKVLQSLYETGFRAVAIAESLSEQLRTGIANNQKGFDTARALQLLKHLLQVPAAHNPEHFLELTLMEAVLPGDHATSDTNSRTAPPLKPTISAASTPAAKSLPVEPKTAKKTVAKKAVPAVSGQLTEADWPKVLAELKKEYNTIYGIVRMAQLDFSEAGKVVLSFSFAFHQKRISDPKNRKIVADIIEQVTGQKVEIVCQVDKDAKPQRPTVETPIAPPPAAESGTLQDISNIFGGGELL